MQKPWAYFQTHWIRILKEIRLGNLCFYHASIAFFLFQSGNHFLKLCDGRGKGMVITPPNNLNRKVTKKQESWRRVAADRTGECTGILWVLLWTQKAGGDWKWLLVTNKRTGSEYVVNPSKLSRDQHLYEPSSIYLFIIEFYDI